MKNYVYLKDGIVFAWNTTDSEIELVSGEIVEVNENPENFMYKKYVDGSFVDSELIKYAIIDPNNNNTVISIEKTYFISEIKNENIIITDPEVKVLWIWDQDKFISPEQYSQQVSEEVTAPPGFVPVTEDPEGF